MTRLKMTSMPTYRMNRLTYTPDLKQKKRWLSVCSTSKLNIKNEINERKNITKAVKGQRRAAQHGLVGISKKQRTAFTKYRIPSCDRTLFSSPDSWNCGCETCSRRYNKDLTFIESRLRLLTSVQLITSWFKWHLLEFFLARIKFITRKKIKSWFFGQHTLLHKTHLA